MTVNTSAPLAVAIVDEALAQLTEVEGLVQGFSDTAIDSAKSLLSSLKTVVEDSIDDLEEKLLQAENLALASNAVAGLSILSQESSGLVLLLQKIAGLI